MLSKSFKAKWKKFGTTNYSKDKEYFNAIVMSDSSFHDKKTVKGFSFKALMYTYSLIIFFVTALSLAMLAFDTDTQKDNKAFFSIVEGIVFIVLLIDLILRWYTSEVRSKRGNFAYFLFPFTITGMLLILSLLPSLYLFNIWTHQHVQIFKTFETMKFLRIFRIVLLANLIPGMGLFTRVLSKEKRTLLTVFGLVIVSIVLFSLVIFNIEQGMDKNGISSGNKFQPDTVQIKTFLDAIYFSTVTLTTIGFGDISPHTQMGKVVVIVMAIIGVAILAIPSGIIAGGFITELKLDKQRRESSSKSKKKILRSK